MNPITLKNRRVLAVDPSRMGFGYAVIETPDVLTDFGVKGPRVTSHERRIAHLANLIDHYQPDALILEDCAGKGSRRCTRTRKLIRDFRTLARRKNIRTCALSPSAVRKAFASTGTPTKHVIASALARRWPYLAALVPPPRSMRPWLAENYWMGAFDAIAFGVAYFDKIEKRRQAQK